ncbi:MAG: hypothetical protein MET45_13155 [Nostoc sp. LLA-1]|nr:hypothetical protein [Cyanocohniella sp. LLY]
MAAQFVTLNTITLNYSLRFRLIFQGYRNECSPELFVGCGYRANQLFI